MTVAHHGFPSLNKNLKRKLEAAQGKCICLYLGLPPSLRHGTIHLRNTNWLLVSERVDSCIATIVFKYCGGSVSSYIYSQCHSKQRVPNPLF